MEKGIFGLPIIIISLVNICLGSNLTIDSEYIIQFKKNVTSEQMLIKTQNHGLIPVKVLSRRMNIWLYRDTTQNRFKPIDLQHFKRIKEIDYIQNNGFVYIEQLKIPNDSRFSAQWSLNNIGQSGGTDGVDIDVIEAWEISTGGKTVTGEEVVVAIIDNGFDLDHEDINYWKNENEIPNNNIDDDGNGYVDDYNGLYPWGNNDKLPVEEHGTHVAGIAGAVGNNGIGICGLGWDLKVLPIAFKRGSYPNDSVAQSDIVEAYSYTLEMRAKYNETDGKLGAFIVATNSSFGISGNKVKFTILENIYDSLGAYGIVNCIAVPNSSIDLDDLSSVDIPSGYPSEFIIAVTNTTNQDKKNENAAWGKTSVDLGAPGTDILSTVPNNSYNKQTGCSMATPHVTGAVALLVSAASATWLAQYKADPPAGARKLKQMIFDGVDPIPDLQGKTVTGGRLNTNRSLQSFAQTAFEEKKNSDIIKEKNNKFSFTCSLLGNEIVINFKKFIDSDVTINLLSLVGKKVATVSVSSVSPGSPVAIRKSIASGSYLLHLTIGKQVYQRKIVVN